MSLADIISFLAGFKGVEVIKALFKLKDLVKLISRLPEYDRDY